jgi:Mrp family chromosome partitioning ATPase
VVLILNAEMVTREATKQAKTLLEKSKAKILGVAINNVDIKKESFY